MLTKVNYLTTLTVSQLYIMHNTLYIFYLWLVVYGYWLIVRSYCKKMDIIKILHELHIYLSIAHSTSTTSLI